MSLFDRAADAAAAAFANVVAPNSDDAAAKTEPAVIILPNEHTEPFEQGSGHGAGGGKSAVGNETGVLHRLYARAQEKVAEISAAVSADSGGSTSQREEEEQVMMWMDAKCRAPRSGNVQEAKDCMRSVRRRFEHLLSVAETTTERQTFLETHEKELQFLSERVLQCLCAMDAVEHKPLRTPVVKECDTLAKEIDTFVASMRRPVAVAVTEGPKFGVVETLHLAGQQISRAWVKSDGTFPNNDTFPALVYVSAFDPATTDVHGLCLRHGWKSPWEGQFYTYHHWHSGMYEALFITKGNAVVRVGGDTGVLVTVKAGDVVLLPPGMAHKGIDENDGFTALGTYPVDSPSVDEHSGPASQELQQIIRDCPVPKTDPLFGMNPPWGRSRQWSALLQ